MIWIAIKKPFRWFGYIKVTYWRNHPLGMKAFVTNKKGHPKYCYRCGNFSNTIKTRHKIFTVPICRKHYDEEELDNRREND